MYQWQVKTEESSAWQQVESASGWIRTGNPPQIGSRMLPEELTSFLPLRPSPLSTVC